MNEYNFNKQKNQEEILSEVDPNAPIVHYYKAEEDEIIKFCMANFITCFLADQCLVIETPISLWKIITYGEDNKMLLYHRNDIRNDDYEIADALVPHYHAQACHRSTIIAYLQYIIAHDDYRDKNPAGRPPKKKKVPQKGTKRYKKAQNRSKKHQQLESIKKVDALLHSLHE